MAVLMKRYPSRFSFPRGVLSALVLICTLALISPSGCKKPTEPSDRDQDTTSHNFSFEVFEIGDSGVLYDVAIVETDSGSMAYAVGELFLRDSSTGELDPKRYNFAVWDGTDWEVERVNVQFRGSVIEPVLEGIFAFSETDIWLVGSLPIYGDGLSWTMYDLRTTLDPNLSLSKVWGSSSDEMYFVGRSGSMARYSQGIWQKLESGTTTHINDVFGVTNPETGNEEVYCAVTDFFEPKDRKILRVTNGTSVDSVKWDTGSNVYTVWTETGLPLFVGGGGLWENSTGAWQRIDLGINSAIGTIRGNGLNDIVVVGAFGLIAHFNGMSWHVFSQVFNAAYSSVSMKGDVLIAVGQRDGKAIATIGKR